MELIEQEDKVKHKNEGWEGLEEQEDGVKFQGGEKGGVKRTRGGTTL